MYKSVLLTIDLGREASWKKALPEAVALVQASGGVLHVLTVVPDFGSPMVAGYFQPDYHDKAVARVGSELKALLDAEVPDEVKVTPHVVFGTVHDEIVSAIGQVGADLVVMASHAPDRVREFLVGSQADRVVRRSPVSVLVVRG
ncbi:universal stress protein [Halovulum sp. GXIMD14793]